MEIMVLLLIGFVIFALGFIFLISANKIIATLFILVGSIMMIAEIVMFQRIDEPTFQIIKTKMEQKTHQSITAVFYQGTEIHHFFGSGIYHGYTTTNRDYIFVINDKGTVIYDKQITQ